MSYARLDNTDEAIKLYKQAIKIKPDYAEAYYNLGNCFKNKKNFNKAYTAYEKSVRFQPDFAQAYFNIGCLLKDQGKLNQAVLAEKAVKNKPDYLNAYYNIADVSYELKYKNANRYYQNILVLIPIIRKFTII